MGGAYGTALVVHVAPRAVDGAATEAALRAVADALDVPRGSVRLVSGATSRTKVVEVTGDDAAPAEAADRLRQRCRGPTSPDRPSKMALPERR